jgi:GT2 family glycosyltransferase
VIVCRNQIEAVRRTLAALLPPGLESPPEVVVVDAGSRDGSAEIDSEFPAVRLVKMPRNFGRTHGNNIGIRTAKGELILLLQPGVALEGACLQQLADALAGDSRAGAVAPRLVDSRNEPQPQTFPLPHAATLAQHAVSLEPLATGAETRAEAVSAAALLIRKSFIAGMNYLDEKRFGDAWAELDLFRQLKNAGRDIMVVDAARAVAPEDAPSVRNEATRALLVCDRIAGAAAYLAKRHGAMAEISFKIKMFGKALISEGGLRVAGGIFNGVKIDGSQEGPLA